MIRRLGAALGAAILLFEGWGGLTGPALAQSAVQIQCGPAHEIAERLTGKYGERQVAHGPVNDGQAHAGLWVNRESRTWTVTLRLGQHRLCMVLAGEDLEFDAESPTPAPEKAPGQDS